MPENISDWVLTSPDTFIYVGISILGAYAALIVLTRLGGIRSFSKMSGFDFAITVAIGSVFATIITTENPPLYQGLIVLTLLFASQIGFAALRTRFNILESLCDNRPRLIMIGQDIQFDQLKKAQMTTSDLMAKLREANVANLNQIKIVIAETTGDVSVIHHNTEVKVSPQILSGVIGASRIPKRLIDR